MIDIRQTIEYANYLESIGWNVENINDTFCFIKKIPLIGSVIKIQRADEIPFFYLNKLAKKHRAFQIVVEPTKVSPLVNQYLLNNNGFKLNKTPFLPTKTIQIDLTKTQKEMLSKMHPKTRYNIKLTKKRGVEIKVSNDINTFAKFWNIESLKNGRFIPQGKEIKSLYKVFANKSNLLTAYRDKILLGGILMIRTAKIAYYMYSASNKQGKKLFASTLLVWKALQLAKKKGCKIFDFEGIYDERFPLPAWKGFTRFKKGFGGNEIEFPGTFVKYLIPFPQ